jgi:Fic family protein
MTNTFDILTNNLLDAYKTAVGSAELENGFEQLTEAEISTDTFSFYTSVASVFSSKIEGEDIELDSYIKHKKMGVKFKPDYTKKIDDLYNAYSFAKNNVLNEKNLIKVHSLLGKHLVDKRQQGEIRTQIMYVVTDDGRIEYVAASPDEVKSEMKKLYTDIETLLTNLLSTQEVFFYAALIHLVFVKIHPFIDGNGRTARLLEKWFLAQKLGDKAWFVQSEKNYYLQHQSYYNNLRILGLEYPELDYSKALPFLVMTGKSLL